jgi:hypothetical protein
VTFEMSMGRSGGEMRAVGGERSGREGLAGGGGKKAVGGERGGT